MRTIDCRTVGDLSQAIEALGPDVLFRGQEKDYRTADGQPDLRTSFTRLGCIPPRMLKWQHYARQILRTFVRGRTGSDDLATDQAVLQHYGWRSFFLDATRDPAVAAWFAGHGFRSRRRGELIEDAFEEPLMVRRQSAWYEAADGVGVLYALSRRALRKCGIQAVDLEEIITSTGRPRYQAQAAFMVGPLRDALPLDCVVAQITAPSEVFRAWASSRRPLSPETLFPGPEDDPVLSALLAAPWVCRGKLGSMGIFDRGLELPEYDVRDLRRTGAATAYYSRYWIADVAAGSPFRDTVFYLTDESFFHGVPPADAPFPCLTRLLDDTPFVAIEMDGLFQPPLAAGSRHYGKGVLVERQTDGLILLCEISVEHRGLQPGGFGLVRGFYYRPDADGRWVRVDHPEQCDCGNAAHHDHHRMIAARFERALAKGEFANVRPGVWAAADVSPVSDPRALETLRPF